MDPDRLSYGSGFRKEKLKKNNNSKKCKEIGNNCNFMIEKITIITNVFFTSENSFVFFSTLHKVICDKVFKAGSGYALRKQLEPVPHLEKQLDPQKINADLHSSALFLV